MEYIDDISKLVHNASKNSGEFRALYEHLVDRIFSYVRYRTSNEEDAIDLTQEVFVDLHKALSTFKYSSKEQFYGFVFTITKRKLAKFYADKHTRAAKNSIEFNEEQYMEPAADPKASADIALALGTLDDTAREIVVLHHWSRYTFPEIASLINMTESAVRVRHHRALKTLSVSLDPR